MRKTLLLENFSDNENNSNIVHNGDGTATLNLPIEFLETAIKQWNTSCIGHFVGGSFVFKFVKDQALKLRGNMGLTDIFYSSKGHFRFKFETITNMQKVLALNFVMI